VKFKKRGKAAERAKKPFDKVSERSVRKARKARPDRPLTKRRASRVTGKPRGRRRKVPVATVTGHAYNFRIQLTPMWEKLAGPLLAAQTPEEVTAAFENYGQLYAREFVPMFATDILALIQDLKFPKRRESRIKFLADSLGGRPILSFRSSRDICERARVQESKKSPHKIIRKEYYVECSCGYKGPALNNACRKCGAEIGFSLEELI
jgi:hypothetical protein